MSSHSEESTGKGSEKGMGESSTSDSPTELQQVEKTLGTLAEAHDVALPSIAIPADEVPGTEGPPTLPDDDVDNPCNWSPARRWLIIIVSGMLVAVNILGPSMLVPAAPQVLETFHVTDATYRTLLVTIWELGEGLSSFVAGPLTEMYGRVPVLHAGNLLALICIVASALSVNISMLIVFRLLTGFFLVAPTIQPAIVGDVTRPENRGAAIAITGMIRVIAPFVAPIMGSYINQALGWRWVIWVLGMLVGFLSLLCVLVVRETYAVKILQRRNKRTANSADVIPETKARSVTALKTILTGLARPIRFLFGSYSLMLLCIYNGVGGGAMYLLITTMTEAMEDFYGFDRGSVGLTYIAPSVGITIGIIIFGLTSDKYISHQKKKNNGVLRPEYRLVHTVFGACFLPFGFVLYGWTVYYRVYFIAPLFGIGMVGFAFLFGTLPVTSYLLDTFGVHSASAVSAEMIVQSAFACTFPLIGPTLFKNLGYGWGNTLLAFLTAAFIPLLIWLMRYKLAHRKDVSSEERAGSNVDENMVEQATKE